MGISAVIGLANIGILAALLVIYARVYKNTKATFTIGLIFFRFYVFFYTSMRKFLIACKSVTNRQRLFKFENMTVPDNWKICIILYWL